MFGLMRAKKCGATTAEKHFRRLNYCGTCKTIGALYSQKARLLLNHDAVFLAELLTALSDENLSDWSESYQSYNCLNTSPNRMPLSLQFAATTNVVLTEFKLADHLADEGKRRYKFAQTAFSAEFHRAENLLKSWNFPIAEVRAVLRTQETRESEIGDGSALEILENLAAPTAETTAIFFAEGAKLIGKNETVETMRRLGLSFGKLIYLLDAFEDYENDFRALRFNAIGAAFNLREKEISAKAKRRVTAILRRLESEIGDAIGALPIAENQKSLPVARLAANLQRKLKTNLPVVAGKKVCAPKPKPTFAQRWRTATEKAGNLARGFSWQMPLVFAFIFVFTLVAPAQSREARTARDCFDLSFNLMFLGAFLGAVLTAPVLTIQKHAPDLFADKAKKKPRADWRDACHCDCCDCCCCCDCEDGCGDGCDCCDCNCD